MNEQPLDDINDDAAELLRSLKPTQPEINWQKLLSHLPESSASPTNAVNNSVGQTTVSRDKTQYARPGLTGVQSGFKRLVSSWWSGALAGSLITFALLRFAGTQPVSNEPQDASVAQSGPSTSTKFQRPTENADGNSYEPQSRTRRQREMEGWDPIVDSGVWSSRFKRHGLGDKLVSKSAPGPTESIQTYESATNSSDGLPKTQAELCRELLEFN